MENSSLIFAFDLLLEKKKKKAYLLDIPLANDGKLTFLSLKMRYIPKPSTIRKTGT